MPKKGKLKESLYTIYFMIMITSVFISVLSFAYIQTRDVILLNEEIFLKKGILYAAGIIEDKSGFEGLTSQEIEEIYKKNIQEVSSDNNSGEISHYNVIDPVTKKIKSYVFHSGGAGLWGEIAAVVGKTKDLKTITGIEFLKQNETPGLGARITEDWFKEQFRGKKVPLTGFVPEGTEDESKTEFDTVTGATATTNAVMKIINNFQKLAEKKIK